VGAAFSRDLTISTIHTSLTTCRLLEFGMQDNVSVFSGYFSFS